MSDESLRELERAWRASGTVEDERRLLAERLRTGQLSRVRCELAAYLGHAPARLALDRPVPTGDRVPWNEWAAALHADEPAATRALVRGLVDAARAGPDAAENPGVPALLDTLDRWHRGDADAAAVSAAVREARLGPVTQLEARTELHRSVVVAARTAGLVAWQVDVRATSVLLNSLTRFAKEGMPWLMKPTDRRGLLVDPLLGWALGAGHRLAPDPTQSDEGPWLAELLRRGEVTRAQLALAAYADDDAARAALGLSSGPSADLATWIARLADFDRALPARVVTALAGHTLVERATQTWLGAPTSSRRSYAVFAAFVRQARIACEALRQHAEAPSEATCAALAAHQGALANVDLDRASPTRRAGDVLLALRRALACGPADVAAAHVTAALEALLAALEDEEQADTLARGLVRAWALPAHSGGRST